MKSIFISVLVSVLFVNAYSQKMTVRELAGLKGKVKTVVTEVSLTDIDNVKNDSGKRLVESVEFYDKAGNLLNNPYKPTPEFKYIFDRKSRIIEKREFDSEGVQDSKTVFKYNAKGQISERRYFVYNNLMTDALFTYDDAGNLTELKFAPTESGVIKEKIIQSFTDYKFDSHKNWIQRTVKTICVLNEEVSETRFIYYRKIEYYKN